MNWKLTETDPPNDQDFLEPVPDGTYNDVGQIKVLMATGSGLVILGRVTHFGDELRWGETVWDDEARDYILVECEYLPYAWMKITNPPENNSTRKLIRQEFIDD
jgi:hypothetical protein